MHCRQTLSEFSQFISSIRARSGLKFIAGALLCSSLFLAVSPAQAVCVDPPGDITYNNDTNVVDVQCGIITVLWTLTATAEDAPPDCVGLEIERADINCDFFITVVDVVLVILHSLELPLAPVVDLDQDGCVDACESGGVLPPGTCGNSVCESLVGETCTTCSEDCGACWGEGECCAASPLPGCPDESCSQCVCDHDPYCCLAAWDAFCVNCAAGGGCTVSPEIAPESSCQYACGCNESIVQSTCCSSQDAPGCDTLNCSDCVCSLHPYCCATSWDSLCVFAAVGTCQESCPCVISSGACCLEHEATGCQNPGCQSCVCGDDPTCCTDIWDEQCTLLAKTACGFACDCPAIGGDCCSVNGGGACDEPSCASCVCDQHPTCCDLAWDQGCVDLTITAECAADCSCKGSCCEESAATGCSIGVCETCVCASNPNCCTGQWSEECTSFAATYCNPFCGCAGGDCCADHEGLGCTQGSSPAGPFELFDPEDITVPALTEVSWQIANIPMAYCSLAVFELEKGSSFWDFESEAGWTSGVIAPPPLCETNGWIKTSVTGGTSPVSFSSIAYGTSNNGGETECENSFLLSPTFDVSGGALLSFDSFVANLPPIAGIDVEGVEVTYDYGLTFTLAVNNYDPVFASNSPPEWAQASEVLLGSPGATEAQIRFRYYEGSSGNGPTDVVGWYVDNIQIDKANTTPVYEAIVNWQTVSHTFDTPGNYAYGCLDLSKPGCTFATDGLNCLMDVGQILVLPTCEECVCATDDFCCDTSWDILCVEKGADSCSAECGCKGGCCNPNATADCLDANCSLCVCALDSSCCTDVWSESCVTLATDNCPVDCGCGSPATGTACCGPTLSKGCANSVCQNCVCDENSFCCDVQWDPVCAEIASEPDCGSVCNCPPQGGDCCGTHFAGGCDETSCTQCVCDQNSYCCDLLWDSSCVSLAQSDCYYECGCSGPCCVGHGGAGCDLPECEDCVCLQDLACCFVLWDDDCAAKAASPTCASPCQCP